MKPNPTRSSRWGTTLLALCATIFSAGMAFATPQKISSDLKAKTAADQVDVIVQFTQVPTAAHHEKILSRGGTVKRELGQFKGAAYSMPASALADLAADPDVVYISPDRPLNGASSAAIRRKRSMFLDRARGIRFSLPHNRDGGCPDAEEYWIGIGDADAHRKARGEMYPVQRAIHLRKAFSDRSIFWKDTPSDAVHNTVEAMGGVLHQIDLNVHPGPNMFQLRFTIAREHPPCAGVNQGKQRSADVRVCTLRYVHVRHVTVERRPDVAPSQV